ncbi:MAG: class I SAM-dependent methyltransferase [Omnitrophica bacterium]|nr:class I SAM-dependent methyltransferase [Candidatus Omnitrophota bacterium]
MRVTYRRQTNKVYWTKRWADIPADQPMSNTDVYPLKFAELTVQSKDGKILEAGCGAGRVLRYYKNRGYNIIGMDFIEEAVRKLKEIDPELNVEVGDITGTRYSDRAFKYVLAFGLFHNLQTGLQKAFCETYRILEPKGKVCVSFRADNIETRFTDWLAERKSRKGGFKTHPKIFHKLNLKKSELMDLLKRAGFQVETIYPVENMPFLYKFPLFRAKDQRVFNENLARKEGYRLSHSGRAIQNFLMRYFPEKFCNIYVLIARKSEEF